MRVFILLRALFLILLVFALLVFVSHSQLCINYRPHDLQGLLKNCESVVNSISSIPSHDSPNAVKPDEKNESDYQELVAIINKEERAKRHVELLQSDNETDEWHKVPIDTQDIRLNVRTCFDFSLAEIVNTSGTQYSDLVSPLRTTLMLLLGSLMLAGLDLGSRLIFDYSSLIQSLVHSVLQIAAWGYVLIGMEVYRRNWIKNWLSAGQQATEVPVYPATWHLFELLAFCLILVSVVEAVLFRCLEWSVRLANSQGVYRCIQKK